MSDDDAEPKWFPPELRDYWAMNIALAGFIACLPCLVLLIALRALSSPEPNRVLAAMLLAALGAVPVILCCLQVSTRYRTAGLAVPSATALCTGAGLLVLAPPFDAVQAALIWGGCFGGLLATAVPLNRTVLAAAQRRNPLVHQLRARLLITFGALAVLAMFTGIPLIGLQTGRLAVGGPVPATVTRWYLFLLSAVLCVWCWLRLFRPFFELCCEVVFSVPYKLRGAGPGVAGFPPLGPVLVIANHSAGFDPLFLAKFIPRPITPMMTERYYRLWFIRPLLKYTFRVIVVPERPVRREAPELQLAVAALERGECVVIFPEGFLQRKPEPVLRRFAQGVWHILHARPDTPVVSCWIEGSWGSLFSYHNGPPLKNKPFDFRRPIGVGMSSPEPVPADVLADQMATRIHLMNRVNQARTHLGLTPFPPFERPTVGETDPEPAQPESPS